MTTIYAVLQNQIACMFALSNGTILTPQQLLACYAGMQLESATVWL